MELTAFQKEWCTKLLEKLMAKKMSIPFHDVLGTGINVFGEIKPSGICLNVVKQRLKDNKYRSMAEFGSDVNKVWRNAFDNFKPDTIMHAIATNLSKWFDKRFTGYPRTEKELFIYELRKLSVKLDYLAISAPAYDMLGAAAKARDSSIKSLDKHSSQKDEFEEILSD